jgi:DNA polymerase-3 subunit delta
MKLDSKQLAKHLAQGLAPIYLVCGDEPLQQMEVCDAIRAQARQQGVAEREVLHAERGFDWQQLLAAGNNLSLFAEQRLLELHIPNGKPGDAGSKALQAYADSPPDDTTLLIIMPKLEAAQQKSKWFKALDSLGIYIPVWPVEAKFLPGWIQQRMHSRGLQADDEAVTILVERTEGNLLAASQEIEKLLLLNGPGAVDGETVEQAVANSARFDVFGLVDAALDGQQARCIRMLHGLQGEGVEPILVLWALAREIRSLAEMAALIQQGQTAERVMGQYRIWPKRKPYIQKGLQRHNLKRWQTLLRRAARIDRLIKGQEAGNVWDELIELVILMAGGRVFTLRRARA